MILLVGATGKVGSRVAAELAARGTRARALVRDPRAAKAQLDGTVDLIRGDLADVSTIARALEGVEVAYLANGQTDRQVELETNFVAAAEAARLPRLVKVTAPHARPDGPHVFGRWQSQIEARIAESGIATTLLRPSMYAANLLGSAGGIRDGKLYSTAADGKLAWVDPADIAAVAVAAIADPAHAGKTYDVTGPEAISYDELAERFSRVLGRPIEHVRIDDDTFRLALTEAGLPAWTVDAFVEMYARGVRARHFEQTSDDVELVLSRPPHSIDEWIEANRAAFES
jgi:(4-alkanoyl-5-oxo-2,5-dihydrofuran-3-yl)methyl phosphate reductase